MTARISMRVRVASLASALAATLLLTAPLAHGEVVGPSLQAIIESCPEDTLLSVVIRPIGTVSPAELKSSVIARYPSRAEQHREVMSALIDATNRSQSTVLDAMKSAELGNEMQNVRGYWIDNIITAEMTPSAIMKVAARKDVESVRLLPDVSLVTPLSAGITEDQIPEANPSHIRAIKADSVWKAGYTGKGRLVGSIDTGVEGKHSTLSSKWRGHNGASVAESWYDLTYSDTVPRVFAGPGLTHGTQVMGLMVAVTGTADTLGVCPDCQWISAAAIGIPCPGEPNLTCGNLFDALQWIADPDGDPNTDWDVPDVVVNPWGAPTWDPYLGCQPTAIGCSDLFWNAIDNIEAAGTLMIFAAGNEGQCGPMSVRNPANRATSETNSFSVGMVDTRVDILAPPLDPLSSRGPSDCDSINVKPELVAPGVYLRTTVPPNGVSSNSAYGTSFPASLTAAGAAVLREYNPNATVDQIKTALLAGAKDLGPVGPDNDYGHGMLDLMVALHNLAPNTQSAIYVKRDQYIPPAPGTATDVVFTLRNCGTPAAGISVEISSADERLSIIDGTALFADIVAYGDSSSNAADPFIIEVDESCLPGERLALDIRISADGGYSRQVGGTIFVGPVGGALIFTHDAGSFRLTVGAAGTFGHEHDNGLDPRPGGVGYLYGADPTQSLFQGALILGTSATRISTPARGAYQSQDVDFRVDPGGTLTIFDPGSQATEETRSAFDDSPADEPIGVFVEQRTFASNEPDHADYLIVEYTIFNRSGAPINDLHCGLYFDWDFPWGNDASHFWAESDGGAFDPNTGLGWMRHRDQDRFRGLCILSQTPLSGYRYFSNIDEIYFDFSDRR